MQIHTSYPRLSRFFPNVDSLDIAILAGISALILPWQKEWLPIRACCAVVAILISARWVGWRVLSKLGRATALGYMARLPHTRSAHTSAQPASCAQLHFCNPIPIQSLTKINGMTSSTATSGSWVTPSVSVWLCGWSHGMENGKCTIGAHRATSTQGEINPIASPTSTTRIPTSDPMRRRSFAAVNWLIH